MLFRGSGRTDETEGRRTQTAGATASLRLVALSDLHMRAMPHDYIEDHPLSGQSLALAATATRDALAEVANGLVFDVGDAYEGGPLDDTVLHDEAPGPHPMSAALASLGLAAGTFGNHDFDHGLAAAERIAAQSPFPLVLCNLVRQLGPEPTSDTPFLPPFVLLDRTLVCRDGQARTIRIGVTGVAPPQTLTWNGDHLSDALAARDSVEAVAAWAPHMRAAGADLVIVLAHTGIGEVEAHAMMEHAAVPIAAVPEVDAVLAGHAHRLFPHPSFVSQDPAIDPETGRLHGTPAVMPGVWGQAIGLVDLELAQEAAGWRVTGSTARLKEVGASVPDPGVVAACADYHRDALAAIRRPVARSPHALHTYFALLADCPATRLVNAAQLAAVRAARPDIAAAEPEVPLLSATAPHRAGGLHGPGNYTDIPAGTLMARHLMDLQVYANRLQVVAVTGTELRFWLERAASVFSTVPPGGQDLPLLDPEAAAYAFDAISGVSYGIDVSRPVLPAAWRTDAPAPSARGRIVDLRLGDRPVEDGDRFHLVTTSYRLGSHPVYAPLRARAEEIAGLTGRAALEAYLTDAGACCFADLPPPAWRFAAVPGAHAVFRTGPGARSYALPELPGARAVERSGTDSDGFDLYRIDLGRADRIDPDAATALHTAPSGAVVAHGAGRSQRHA